VGKPFRFPPLLGLRAGFRWTGGVPVSPTGLLALKLGLLAQTQLNLYNIANEKIKIACILFFWGTKIACIFFFWNKNSLYFQTERVLSILHFKYDKCIFISFKCSIATKLSCSIFLQLGIFPHISEVVGRKKNYSR